MEVMSNKFMSSDNKREEIEEGEGEEVMAPGFRFHPTDEELVGFYLQRKVKKKPLRIELIKQIDIYRYHPWDLPSNYLIYSLFTHSFIHSLPSSLSYPKYL